MPRLDEIDLPAGAVQEYVRIAGIAAVYVASSPSGVCRIDASRDLKRTQTFLHKQGHDLTIIDAFWVDDTKTAKRIASRVNKSTHRAGSPLTQAEATAQIAATATTLKVHLTQHNAVIQRAETAMTHVRTTLEHARKNGGLHFSTEPSSTFGREQRHAGTQR